MNINTIRETAKFTLASRAAWLNAIAIAEEKFSKDYMDFTDAELATLPADLGIYNVMDAKRNLELADIAEKLTDGEKQILCEIPAYSKDLHAAKSVKVKYGVSWSELETLRQLCW